MSEKTPDPAGKGLARRRLLRGAFAAPAVLTLYSGGTLAATSATCVAKAQFPPQTGEVLTGTRTDTFMRVQLYQRPSDGYWLWGNSISAFSGADNIVQKDRYTKFRTNVNLLSTNSAKVDQSFTPSLSLSDPPKWVALRFDGTGELVGVGADEEGSAINGSCWNSVYDN